MIPRLKQIDGRPNFHKVDVGNRTFYFSYETCVAFTDKGEVFCCENKWGNTTGKHLNQIEPDKDMRMKFDSFMFKLEHLED